MSGNPYAVLIHFDHWLKYPINFFHIIGVWFFFPALLMIVLTDIILRTFFNSPLSWGHEVLGLLLIGLFSLELPRCVQRGELLSVDLLINRLNRQVRLPLIGLSLLLVLAFSVLFCWQGAAGAMEMYEYGEQAFSLPIPFWPFSFLMACVGSLLVLQVLVQLANLAVDSKSARRETECLL